MNRQWTAFKGVVLGALLSILGTSLVASPVRANTEAESKDDKKKSTTDGSEKESKKKSKKYKKVRYVEVEVEADTSQDLREGKKGMVTWTAMGFDMVSGPNAGVDFGYYLNPNLVIAGRYEHGKNNGFTFMSSGFGVEKRTSSTFALYGKKFFGNSFYANFGLAYRKVYAEVATIDFIRSGGYIQDYAAQHVFAAIGNQWQWEYFTLGCDWVGFYSPYLAKQLNRDEAIKSASGDVELSDIEDADAEKGLVRRSLALYLGVSF